MPCIHVCAEIYYYGCLFLFGTIQQTMRPPEPLISFTLISLNKLGRLNRFDGTSHAGTTRRMAQKKKKMKSLRGCGWCLSNVRLIFFRFCSPPFFLSSQSCSHVNLCFAYRRIDSNRLLWSTQTCD